MRHPVLVRFLAICAFVSLSACGEEGADSSAVPAEKTDLSLGGAAASRSDGSLPTRAGASGSTRHEPGSTSPDIAVHQGRQAQDEFVEAVRDAIESRCQADSFSGAVLLAHEDRVLFESACGEASKRFGVPNRVDTKFNLGSMNKMFTSIAVMQLVEQGVLGLDDSISEYVDASWLPREVTDRVTIRQLLAHTSGLGSYFNDTYMRSSRAQFRELDDYKPLVQGDTPAFEPGERFRYSNTGMFLLGVVIESVTGENYFEYIREHIYAPAGMTQSDSYSMDEPVPNLAIGYARAPDGEYGWRNNVFEHVMRGGPAGGGFSTVQDLHAFARALLAGELLSEVSREQMWIRQSNEHYGFGFQITDDPLAVGHGGGFIGISANLDIFPETGYVVAVLSNYGMAAPPLVEEIRDAVGRMRQP